MTVSTDQEEAEVLAFLENPMTYGRSTPVIRIDTHGAAVFLAGPDVYKVKRRVRLPFMDFSTLEKRHTACLAEITVNRDNAPDLYLGVVPITRDQGGLTLGGDGQSIEWTLHLRRFDENATLDRLASKGSLDAALINKLAQAVVVSHRRSPVRDGAAAKCTLRRLLQETVVELVAEAGLFSSDRTNRFGAALICAFDQAESILARRGQLGQIRHCHGDLHLGNIALIDNAPVLFDALEFDESIATIDVLYDLAFVIMDLCERNLRPDANRLLNRYLALCDDESLQIEGLTVLPLFLALRAAIRAKVKAALFRADPAKDYVRDAALSYFEAGIGFLAPVPPVLVAIGGLSGAGKTTLAEIIAPALGRAPGAVHLRSDVERKRLFGVAQTTRLPADAYRPPVSESIYANLAALSGQGLSAGQAVLVDAGHRRPEERHAIAAVAERAGVPFVGLWLDAPLETLKQRVQVRQTDASDATAAVVAEQAEREVGLMTWARLDAARSLNALMGEALDVIRRTETPVYPLIGSRTAENLADR